MKQRFKSKVYQSKKIIAKLKKNRAIVVGNGTYEGDTVMHHFEIGDIVEVIKVSEADKDVFMCLRRDEKFYFYQYVSREHLVSNAKN